MPRQPARQSVASIFQTAAARIARDGYRPRGTHSAREVAAYIARRTGMVPCQSCGAASPVGQPFDASRHGPDCQFLAPAAPPARPVGTLRVQGYHSGPALRGFHGTPDPALPRYIGVEVESILPGPRDAAEGRLIECSQTWGATGDSSISARMGERGCEWVSPAMRGQFAIDQIIRLSRALVAAGARVDRSTGLHIHVDTRDLDNDQWLGAVRVACKVEEAIYSIITPGRRSCGYSDPRNAPVLATARLSGNHGVIDQHCRNLPCSSRYHGINLTNRHGKNTIEFRYHHGTVDHKKIVPFARILVAVVEYARTYGVDAVCGLAGMTSVDALRAVLAAIYGAGEADTLMTWVGERRAAMQAPAAAGR